MKLCPYCEKKIQNTAIVCRYCGKELSEVEPSQNKEKKKLPKKKILFPLGITLGVLVLAAGAWWLFRPLTLQITEISDSALWRSSYDAEFAQVKIGQKLQPGAEVWTGETEGVLLNFSDGTILRIAPNSIITVMELNTIVNDLAARIALSHGEIWVILKGRELDVLTPLGNASVKGSYMSTSFNAMTQTMDVTCLEGNCSLQNDQGDTSLTDGQMASVTSNDAAPSAATTMEAEEYADWERSNPEAKELVGDKGDGAVQTTTTSESSDTNVSNDFSCEEFPLTKAGCFPYHFENNCLGGEGNPELATWHWSMTYQVIGETYCYKCYNCWITECRTPIWEYPIGWVIGAIPPGTTSSGTLPVGFYTVVMDWTGESDWWWQSQNKVLHRLTNQNYTADSNLNVKLCPNDPPLPTGTLTEPIKYYYANNCVGDSSPFANTVWHWTFEMVRGANPDDPLLPPMELIIPLGESRTGELPPGYYIERDWTENRAVNHLSFLRSGSDNVDLCLDSAPLPDKPDWDLDQEP